MPKNALLLVSKNKWLSTELDYEAKKGAPIAFSNEKADSRVSSLP